MSILWFLQTLGEKGSTGIFRDLFLNIGYYNNNCNYIDYF